MFLKSYFQNGEDRYPQSRFIVSACDKLSCDEEYFELILANYLQS